MGDVLRKQFTKMMLYIYEYRKLCLFDVQAAYTFDPLPSIPRKNSLQPILGC